MNKAKIKMDINNLATTFIGSVLLMAVCFEKEWSSEIKKAKLYWKYQDAAKNTNKYFKTPEQTWDINYILNVFGIKRTHDWPIALVTSDVNCIVCPYVTDDTEEKVIPISPRTDGLAPYTLRHAKTIQPIKWQ